MVFNPYSAKLENMVSS